MMLYSKALVLFFASLQGKIFLSEIIRGDIQLNASSNNYEEKLTTSNIFNYEQQSNIFKSNNSNPANAVVHDYVGRKPRSQEKQFLVGTPQGPALAVRRPLFPVRLSPAMAFLIPAIPALLGKHREGLGLR